MEKEVVEEVQLSKEEKELNRKKENNIKLYSIYRIFSWDLLFYYAVIYLFLTVEKNISASQILQIEAFYIFFKFLTQIPSTLLIQKMGKRKSLIIGNFIAVVHILIMMFSNTFNMILISQLLCALAFSIKATCETDMLYDSLERGEKRGIKFSKIDGKASSRYYYIDAISAVLSGFLFVINSYIPMILCFIVLLITFLMSLKFEEIHKEKGKMHIREEITNIKFAFKSILTSKRLRSLLIYNACFVAVIKIVQNIRNTIFLELNIPEQYFGIIVAAFGLISGIAAKSQGKIHKKYKNKTLTFLSIPTAVSCLLMGVVLLLNMDIYVKTGLIIGLLIIQYIMRGPFYILIKQYINNFTNSEKRVKISTTNNLFENLVASILTFGAAAILDVLPASYTMLIIGCIATVMFTLLLDYMRGTVGLKPEEYSKKEILQ